MKEYAHATLEGAIICASKDLLCSVLDLEYEIIQSPRRGFLGLFPRKAIILAKNKLEPCVLESEITEPKVNKEAEDENLDEIRSQIKEMLSFMPYEISKMQVSLIDGTLNVEIDGDDAPLLIGDKGYRYNALSYLLFNWIYPKYGYGIRLEIGQFLKTQEEFAENYIKSIEDEIQTNTITTTKNLNKNMQIIVLNMLRKKYPKSYIYIKKEAHTPDACIVIKKPKKCQARQ